MTNAIDAILGLPKGESYPHPTPRLGEVVYYCLNRVFIAEARIVEISFVLTKEGQEPSNVGTWFYLYDTEWYPKSPEFGSPFLCLRKTNLGGTKSEMALLKT